MARSSTRQPLLVLGGGTSGGSGTPGGSNGQIQYNNGGAFGGLASTGTGDVVRAADPALTGVPTAPTAVSGTDTTQIASTAFVQQELVSKSYVDGEVTNYADLPVTVGTPSVNSVYLVKQWSISNPFSFPGAWMRITNDGDLDDWRRLGNEADMFADAYFRIADDSDSSKKIAFSAGGITVGQTRVLTPLDKNYTLEETGHAAKHAAAGADPVTLAQSQVTNLTADIAVTKKGSIQFGKSNNGSALSTGVIDFAPQIPYGATLTAWSISVDTGTATVTFWKKAAGTAIPTIADLINTSGVAISTGTHVRSTTMTDFTTTTVTANDLFRCAITAVSGATWINVQLEYTRT